MRTRLKIRSYRLPLRETERSGNPLRIPIPKPHRLSSPNISTLLRSHGHSHSDSGTSSYALSRSTGKRALRIRRCNKRYRSGGDQRGQSSLPGDTAGGPAGLEPLYDVRISGGPTRHGVRGNLGRHSSDDRPGGGGDLDGKKPMSKTKKRRRANPNRVYDDKG